MHWTQDVFQFGRPLSFFPNIVAWMSQIACSFNKIEDVFHYIRILMELVQLPHSAGEHIQQIIGTLWKISILTKLKTQSTIDILWYCFIYKRRGMEHFRNIYYVNIKWWIFINTHILQYPFEYIAHVYTSKTNNAMQKYHQISWENINTLNTQYCRSESFVWFTQ